MQKATDYTPLTIEDLIKDKKKSDISSYCFDDNQTVTLLHEIQINGKGTGRLYTSIDEALDRYNNAVIQIIKRKERGNTGRTQINMPDNK